MDGSEEKSSSGPCRFDMLKRFPSAAEIVAELSPPSHEAAPFVEGPYGLPMAPFMSPAPNESSKITEKLGDQTMDVPAEKPKRSKREVPKRAQSERLLQKAFSVKCLSDLSNPSSDNRSSVGSSKAKKSAAMDKEKRKRTKSNRLCELIQDGKSEALPGAIVAIEDKSRRRAAKSKHNLLRKSASADCVTHLLDLEEDADEDVVEAPETPETKRTKSQVRSKDLSVKGPRSKTKRKDASDVLDRKSAARPKSRRVASDPQMTAEKQCKTEQAQHYLLRKSTPVDSVVFPKDKEQNVVRSESNVAKSKNESPIVETSKGKEKRKKASEVIENGKPTHKVTPDPQLTMEDRRHRVVQSKHKLLRKSASADCLTDVIGAEDESDQVGEYPEATTADAISLPHKKLSKEKRKRAKDTQSSTAMEDGRPETLSTKKTKSKAKRASASDRISREKCGRKAKPGQSKSRSVASNPLVCNETEKKPKMDESKYTLLRKSASADCVTEPLLEEADSREEPQPTRAKAKVKSKTKCEDSGRRKDSIKHRQKLRRTKSSCDVLGLNAEPEQTTCSGVTTSRKKSKRASGRTSKPKGVERSSSSSNVTALLSCDSSNQTNANLSEEKEQKGEGNQIHNKETKRRSKHRSRPKLDRSVSVSYLPHAPASSEDKSLSSRKAASRLKRKAKLKKSSAQNSPSMDLPDPTVAAPPSTASKTQKLLPRSNSTPDVFVESYPIPNGFEETSVANEPSRRQMVEPPQNSLKKTNSLPDLMQKDQAVDCRIADLSEPQKMSLSEACRLLKLNDQNLTSLDLSDASIGDFGLETLSKAMENNWYLRELHLGRSGITHVGAVPLAKSLRRNKTLERLYLQSNEIGDEGVEVREPTFAFDILTICRSPLGSCIRFCGKRDVDGTESGSKQRW